MNYQDFSSDIQLKDTFFVTSVEEIEEQMKTLDDFLAKRATQ
jgi:hypothetical protein